MSGPIGDTLTHGKQSDGPGSHACLDLHFLVAVEKMVDGCFVFQSSFIPTNMLDRL